MPGDPARAIPALKHAPGLCQTWSFLRLYPGVAFRLGAAYTLTGRVPNGQRLLEEAQQRGASSGIVSEGTLRAIWLAESYLLSARVEDAARFTQLAYEIAMQHGENGHRAWMLLLIGEVAARSAGV
jgi:hypothetical protein